MSTQIPEETLKQWREEAMKYIEHNRSIHAPLDLYMLTRAYVDAKTSSYERIFQLEEELRVMRNDKA